MIFYDYAQSKGLELLSDDKKWLRTIVSRIPHNERKLVLQRYVEIWCEAMGSRPNASQAMNLGRRMANNFIRETIEKK